MITMEFLAEAVTVVTMMLLILSVPAILLTVRNSARLLKRYKMLRNIKDVGDEKDVPPQVLNEWNAVNSPMGYTTLITDEIERLNGLKPAFFQAELAAVLMVVLMITGCEQNVLILMIVLTVIAVLSVVYGILNTSMYTQEYLRMLKEISDGVERENGSADGMYG